MAEEKERSLELDPTWSVAVVITMFVAISLLVERSIHRLSSWLRKTNRKSLYEALEKMKEELMLLGFISLLLTATSKTISNICIDSKFYVGTFTPCSKSQIDGTENDSGKDSKQLMHLISPRSFRRLLKGLNQNNCEEGYEPFVSYEGLEELHRFIFIMAITHISYSCITMLLAVVKIYTWREWEDEAHNDMHDTSSGSGREQQVRRHSMIVKFHSSNPFGSNRFLVWVTCFFRQFGQSVGHVEYLALRMGFVKNHNLTLEYDFHSYMIRSMEEEFHKIVGLSVPLWGFVVGFMLFDVKGSNLYFWIAIIPIALVLVLGTKLQHIVATLSWENAGITGFFTGTRLKPRDDLFWFKKPQLVLSLIHFVLFQNSFELASFFWFWWQFGYESCFLRNHLLVYLRLILGFAGQFLCSYSTLPLYALATQEFTEELGIYAVAFDRPGYGESDPNPHRTVKSIPFVMGTNYKAALIPERIRETLHAWKKEAKRKRRHGIFSESSSVHTYTDTVLSIDEDEQRLSGSGALSDIELPNLIITTRPAVVANESSSRVGTPLLRPSASVSSTNSTGFRGYWRPSSLPVRR